MNQKNYRRRALKRSWGEGASALKPPYFYAYDFQYLKLVK